MINTDEKVTEEFSNSFNAGEMQKLIERAGNGEAEAIIELASLLKESDSEADKRKAFLLYQKANDISGGNVATIAHLAVCYCDGIGTNKDTVKGLKMFREAANSGDLSIQYNFACKLRENNDLECIKWFEMLCNIDEKNPIAAESAYNIASVYKDGFLVEKNQEKRNDYLWKAAEMGNKRAVLELWEMYNSGYVCNDSVKNDENIPYLERLANVGSVEAAKKLTNEYEIGNTVERDISTAIQWAGVAAKNGDPEFTYEFSFKLENIEDKKKCLELAAEQHHAKSIGTLGHIYSMNDNEIAKLYYIQALKLNDSSILTSLKFVTGYSAEGQREYFNIIKDCADHECAAANLEMYRIYIGEGKYAQKDEMKAAEYLNRAVEAEYPPALCILGNYYADGSFGYPKDMLKAFSIWMKASEGGDGTSAWHIGNCFRDGIPVSQDIDEAIKWYIKSAEYGNPKAYGEIGAIYENAEFGRQDHEKSLDYYTKGYENGDDESTLALAKKYENGIGVELNPSKAFELMKYAADYRWGKEVILETAKMCLEGRGTEPNPVMAVEYLEKIRYLGKDVSVLYKEAKSRCAPKELFDLCKRKAETGDHIAEYELFEWYSGEKGIPRDNDKAVEYLKKSADGGYVIALNKLGEIEKDRLNFILAAECWEKAAQLGLYSHSYDLACLYLEGDRGVQLNVERGLELMRKAAELGNADAQSEMGVIYYEGKFVAQNYSEAFKWVQMAANANNALAQNNLGMFYKQGIGCSANPTMAVYWYEKASNQGYFNAMVCYAYMLYKGEGTVKQPKRTETLFRKILETKNLLNSDPELYKNTLYYLASLYTDELHDPFAAFDLWKELAGLGNPIAQYNLGVFYLNGTGTAKDRDKAKAYFTRALTDGVKQAQDCLDLIKKEENIEEMERRQKNVYEYAQKVQNRGCYVATAVYGSYDCPEVWVLRRFRDRRLSMTKSGRTFIRLYYKISPICVKRFGTTKIFKRFFKFFLDRMVNKLRTEGYEDFPYYDC